jgi:AraC-like DNA-binding protein
MLDPAPVTLLDATLRGTLIALLLLLAAVLLRDRPRVAAAGASVAMMLGLCVQVIGATPLFEAQVPPLWQLPFVVVSAGNAVLFWVFVQAMFDDAFALRPVHIAAWLAVAGLSAFNCFVPADGASAVAPVTHGLQRAVPLIFAVLAALAVAAHWRADLVEERRKLRIFVAAAGVAYSLTMLAVRLGSPQGRLSTMTATIDVMLLLAIVAVAAWHMLRLSGTDLFAFARSADAPVGLVRKAQAGLPLIVADTAAPAVQPPDPAEDHLAQALQRLMVEERVYRTEDLTVASLAARLAVPEYRLRRLINQRLKHRNFNAFVNAYRLDEARAALADPAQRGLPVLTIALEAGFQSIGPFNRAFKAATGLTPTEFRKEKLADS